MKALAQPIINLAKRLYGLVFGRKPKVKRAHKSFRLSRRSNYTRRLELPGYWQSLASPFRLFWRHKKLYISFLVVYSLVSVVVVGLASQDTYNQMAQFVGALDQGFNSQVLGEALTLALTGMAGGFTAGSLNSSGAAAAILVLIGWLTIIWLTRALMRGEKPRLRDGLYNSGSPIVPVALLVLIGLVQLIPAAIAVLVLRAGISSGFITTGIEGMILAVPVVLLMALSLYWLTTTILATIVVTLPGMYPLRAHQHAYDLIQGRRLTMVLRVVWLILIQVTTWLLVLMPIIIIERALHTQISWLDNLAIVPVVVLLLTSFSLLYVAIYSYQLYRNVVDYDAR